MIDGRYFLVYFCGVIQTLNIDGILNATGTSVYGNCRGVTCVSTLTIKNQKL